MESHSDFRIAKIENDYIYFENTTEKGKIWNKITKIRI